jgi:hypothetical protein
MEWRRLCADVPRDYPANCILRENRVSVHFGETITASACAKPVALHSNRVVLKRVATRRGELPANKK